MRGARTLIAGALRRLVRSRRGGGGRRDPAGCVGTGAAVTRSPLAGTRIRERRLTLGIKQADLAQEAGISPSYLNLIEHNRRRIGGALLGRIARALSVDISALTRGADAKQIDALSEAATRHRDAAPEADRIDEFVGRFPGWSRVVAAQQRRIEGLEHEVAGLTDRLVHDPFLAGALHEILSKVAAIRSTASILTETDDIDGNWLRRFHRNLGADSRKLSESAAALAGYLEAEGSDAPAALSAQEEVEAFLESHGFHFPALETAGADGGDDIIDRVIDAAAAPSDAARADLRDHLRTYLHDARRLPLAAFAQAAVETAFDPARLAAQFGTDLAAAVRRMATLPADQGAIPIGLVACDAAGALTLRKSTDLLPMPRFGSACALWPLFDALARPHAPVRATLASAARPAIRFTAIAVSETRYPEGSDGPVLRRAVMAILPETVAAVPDAGPDRVVGSACRVCVRQACPARRDPALVTHGFDTGEAGIQ